MSKKSASMLKTNLLHSHLADKQTIAHYLQLRDKQIAKQQWQVHPVITTKESCKTANSTKWHDTAMADCNHHHNCASNNNRRNVARTTTHGNNGDATFSFHINPLWCISTTTTSTARTATIPTTQHQHHSNSHHYHHRHRNKSTLHNNHHNQRHANNTQYPNNTHIKCNLYKSKANLENSQQQHQHHHHHHQQPQTHLNIVCNNAQKSSMLVSEPNHIFHKNDKNVPLKNLKNTKYYHHHHHHHQNKCHAEIPSLATPATKISHQHETRLSLSPKVCHKMSQHHHQEQQLLCMFQVVSPLKSKSAATTTTTKTLHQSIWHLDGSSTGVAPPTSISCLPLKKGTKHFNLDYKTVLQCLNSISKPSDQDVIFGNARLLLSKCYGWEKSRIEWLEQLEQKQQQQRQQIPLVLQKQQ